LKEQREIKKEGKVARKKGTEKRAKAINERRNNRRMIGTRKRTK
jgi:hypothetical protein